MTIKRWRHLVPVALVVLSTACSSSLQVRSIVDSQASFDRYRTYAFVSGGDVPGGFDRVSLDADRLARARDIVPATLSASGWSAASREDADIVLRVGLGRRRHVEVSRLYHPSDEYVSGSSFAAGADDLEVEIDERSIAIDAFDRETGSCVWHGVALTERGGTELSPDEFGQAIRELLSRLPAPR